MDSLLANYASSDEEEEKESEPSSYSSLLSNPSLLSSLPPPKIPNSSSSSSSSLFSSLPPPKSQKIEEIHRIESKQTRPIFSSHPPPKIPTSSPSSLFSSLPPPKSQQVEESQSFQEKQKRPIFSSLPPPKSQPAPDPNPKRVVQFTLPLNPSLLKPNDFDDEDDVEEETKPVKDSSDSAAAAAPKGLSLMLPAPKNSLGLAPTAASRRSAFNSSLPASSKAETLETRQESSNLDSYGSSKADIFEGGEQQQQQQESGNFEDHASYPLEQGAGGYENYGSYDGSWASNRSADASFASSYQSYQSGGYENYGSYGGNRSDGNAAVPVPVVPEIERIVGKRGRNEIPMEIVEVNQAELMKNRPREDQVKATGIAFGPAYQAVSSSKGKPTKLHKRKHQIGSLYFDMKQKEMELAERRAKGFLTKAETQAKYGW